MTTKTVYVVQIQSGTEWLFLDDKPTLNAARTACATYAPLYAHHPLRIVLCVIHTTETTVQTYPAHKPAPAGRCRYCSFSPYECNIPRQHNGWLVIGRAVDWALPVLRPERLPAPRH